MENNCASLGKELTEKNKTYFIKGVEIFLAFTFIVFILGIICAAFRGILMCDESVNLLRYANPRQELHPTTYYIIVNKIFGWLPAEIYVYRLLSLMFNLLSSIVFFIGFWTWLKSLFENHNILVWNKITVFLFIIIGNLISFFVFTGGLGYNSLNNALILVSSGCIFWVLGKKELSKKAGLVIYTCGALIGIDFFIKFSASILFLLCSSIIMPYKKNNLLKLYNGFIIGLIIYFILFQSPVAWLQGFFYAIFGAAAGTHSLSSVLNAYISSILLNISLILKNFSLPLLLITLGLLTLRFEEIKFIKWIRMTLLTLGTAFIFISIIKTNLYNPKDLRFYITIFFIILTIQVILNLLSSAKTLSVFKACFRKALPGIVFLFFLPFIMAFGTNIPIVLLAYNHIMPWFALFVLMSILGILSSKLDYKFQLILPLTAIFFAWAYFICIFIFRLDFPNFAVINQNYRVNNITKLKHMRVGYDTKTFIESTHSLLLKAGFKKGDGLVGFNIPFFVYAFDAKSPGAYWYTTEFPVNNCLTMTSVKTELEKSYFLLPSKVDPDHIECIVRQDFLKDHEYAGHVTTPYNIYSIDKGVKLLLFKPVNKLE
ncbi:MAG: hypothetical protein A2287_01555 [Candidatus Melainabacteria bacterium RIFOXYA12_FULL_32_12]|nr:MAG: hypothetical protein A2287_01555 [Candidatus Melainabacteria bacterium RIFOXYA12_FULL_32_12]